MARQQSVDQALAFHDPAIVNAHQTYRKLPGWLHHVRLLEDTLARSNQHRPRNRAFERDRRFWHPRGALHRRRPLLRRDFFQVLQKANTSSFKRIIIQTNGLLLKKLHKDIHTSPITRVAVSIDGLKPANDLIRGIDGLASCRSILCR